MSPLLTRTVVGVVLIVVALGAVYAGGVLFTALVAIAVLLMFAEWCVMFNIGRGLRLAGLLLLAGVIAALPFGPVTMAIMVLAGGAAGLGLFARNYDRQRAFWLVCGVLYCGLPGIALLWLRGGSDGQFLVIGSFVVVWATDTGAYFAGRAIGGPKFAARISPNKTWAGVVGGIVAAMLTITVLGYSYNHDGRVDDVIGGVVLSGLLAMLAILGDLFESWLKRRAEVKDSGSILPGHGGVLDRLDGLVPVVIVVALTSALFPPVA